MEHRDGSGHVCVKRSPSGAVTTKLYIRNDEVMYVDLATIIPSVTYQVDLFLFTQLGSW
jgi:hypothetical protein